MSMPVQQLSPKISSDSTKEAASEEKKSGDFLKLWKVNEIDEKRHRSLFSLVEEATPEEKEADNETEGSPIANIACPPPRGIVAAEFNQTPAISGSASTASASIAMELLFEKMASHMIVMEFSGETQTSFFLDNPQLASSPFFGTQIIIKEFSTAPKAFNIEIISNPLAITTIQQHQQQLLSLFALGNFNFTIHRLETHLSLASDDFPSRYQEEKESESKEQQKDENS